MGDKVNHPGHYADNYPFEVIELIEMALGSLHGDISSFDAYCLGNELKYRMRAGFKGDPDEDIAKAMKYNEFRTVQPNATP